VPPARLAHGYRWEDEEWKGDYSGPRRSDACTGRNSSFWRDHPRRDEM